MKDAKTLERAVIVAETKIQAAGKKTRRYKKKPKPAFDSQKYRGWVQLFWFAVTIWIGLQFYFFVYYYLAGEKGIYLPRPPGVEGFLPISSLISLRSAIETGQLSWVHPAGLALLVIFISASFILRKSFCSFMCPVGTVSESLGAVGRKIFKKRLKLPAFLDYPLRSLKYLLLAFFLYAVFYQMSSADIQTFLNSPYNQVADVKMLLFFTRVSEVTFWVLLVLVVLSVIYEGVWCRYLCPYGALLGFIGLFSPVKIRRNSKTCIDCLKCSKVCPSRINVHKMKAVNSDECFGCMACVDACPVQDTLDMKLPGGRKISPRTYLIAAFMAFLIPILAFKVAGYWDNNITSEEYKEHIENIDSPLYHHNRGQVMTREKLEQLNHEQH
ncbi:MAG TPA: 4Fe-4S binding protein [candidate division Zixibacteria bacterium]|nr:4Fe-4S binding protein [candidate division Zixibacteria bacterium]